MFYCLPKGPVRAASRKPVLADPPDPYGESAPGFAERTRQTVTQLTGGMVRVDIGEPISGSPLPKPKRSRKAAPPPPEPTPPSPTAPQAPATADPIAEVRGRFRMSQTLDR